MRSTILCARFETPSTYSGQRTAAMRTSSAATGSSRSMRCVRSSRSPAASGVWRYSVTRSWRAPWRRHQASASTSRWVVVAYVSEPVSSWMPSAKAVASSGVGCSSRSARMPTSVVVNAPSVEMTADSAETQSGTPCSPWWSKSTVSTAGSSATLSSSPSREAVVHLDDDQPPDRVELETARLGHGSELVRVQAVEVADVPVQRGEPRRRRPGTGGAQRASLRRRRSRCSRGWR